MQVGIALALVAALMTNLASLLKHRGCHRAEPVSIRRPLRSARTLAGSRWFAAGWALAALAWLIHVAALSMAPISIVLLAGILIAFAGIAIKGLLGAGGISLAVLAPWIALTVLCGALAQYATVAALQGGQAIETIGLLGLVANATQIAGGVLVFGDPLSDHPLGIALQTTAFAMVCASALLLPSRSERRLATA